MVEEAEVIENALVEHATKGDLFYLEHLTLNLTIDTIGRVKYNTSVMNHYFTQELARRYGAMQETTAERNSKISVIDLALKAYLEELPTAKGIDADFKEFAMAQIKLFIFAGHDTISTVAVFTYHLLAKYPEVLAKVRAEHSRVFGTSNAASLLVSTPSLLNRLTYTLAVIKESLRLYPTVAAWREG
ncbi:MAG: hypothetical protein Q9177_000810 [Variospora cf. flavescens]